MKKYTLAIVGVVFSLGMSGCTPTPQNSNENSKMTSSTPLTQSNQIQPYGTQSAITNQQTQTMANTESTNSTYTATIKTSKGEIILDLYDEAAPATVKNFNQKATNGFYNKLTFHRVEDWVIQGGDPKGNGTGGGKMPTELNDLPFVTGSVGVARGMDITVSNDAQFFICTQDCRWLDKQYTNFGKVVKGMDVVNNIAIGDTIQSIVISETK